MTWRSARRGFLKPGMILMLGYVDVDGDDDEEDVVITETILIGHATTSLRDGGKDGEEGCSWEDKRTIARMLDLSEYLNCLNS